VDDAAEAVGVHDRDQHGDRGGEKDPHDHACQKERVHRHPACGVRDQVHGDAGDESPAEAQGSEPQRLDDSLSEARDLPQHHPEGCAARNAQDRGLGQRIAREGLEAGARDGERAPCQEGSGDARQPDRKDDGAVRALGRAAAGDEVEDSDGRHGGCADEEGSQRDGSQQEQEAAANPGEAHSARHFEFTGLVVVTGWPYASG
jgi:hypothetical protein